MTTQAERYAAQIAGYRFAENLRRPWWVRLFHLGGRA